MQISAEAERRLAMKAKLVGVQGIHFTNNSGEEVNGTKIYCAFQDENVEGLRTADFFLKDGITLPKDTKLNDAIDISFNMKGKSHSMVQNAVNDNPRAKLLKIEKFGKDDNWDINLHWTDEEKEALGIKKKDNIMNLDEFNGYISELIDEIHDYQGAIEWLKEDL